MKDPANNYSLLSNKSKWQGKTGWEAQFKRWKNYLESHTTLELNAILKRAI